MAPLQSSRPPLPTADTLDEAPRLSGQVSTAGVASLDLETLSQQNGSALAFTNGSATRSRGAPSPTDDEEDIENYDLQIPDPDAIITASTGGRVQIDLDGASGVGAKGSRDSRRKNTPIRLEKTGKRGKYMLHADDAEVGEILRRGIEKQQQNASGKRHAVRDLVFTRRFTTFDRQSPSSYDSPFHGFFTLFWIGMALMLLRVAATNWRIYGSILGQNELFKMMFSQDKILLAVVDGVLVGSTVFGLFLQKAIAKGYIDWGRSGYIIENVWQLLYVGAFTGWTFYRDWPWTHTIFIVLHGLVFLMKQHSYSFYNGYLSQVLRRKELLERKLKQLEAMTPMNSPISSPPSISSPTSTSRPKSSDATLSPVPDLTDLDGLHRRRRRSSQHAPPPTSKSVTNLATEPDDIAAIQHAITTHQPITTDQMTAFSSIIRTELLALTTELRGKCATTTNHYPSNLTLSNFAEWTCLPTLVYELEYPRQPSTNWLYVLEKTAATFGTLLIMNVISQAYIYPPVAAAVALKAQNPHLTLAQRWEAFPWLLSDMLFPLLLEQLLTWYVIWECVLNVLAEVTRFADRGFYGAWWNSVSWDQYARDWNRPVHNFLLRHVYHSSISAFHLSKGSATFVTFLLSACVHELVMACLFKKVRGYLFGMQLMQLPLVALSRTRLLKGRSVLGNVFFWIGLFVGPSFLTSLYLVV